MPRKFIIDAFEENVLDGEGKVVPGWTKYTLRLGDVHVVIEGNDKVTCEPGGARLFSKKIAATLYNRFQG